MLKTYRRKLERKSLDAQRRKEDAHNQLLFCINEEEKDKLAGIYLVEYERIVRINKLVRILYKLEEIFTKG